MAHGTGGGMAASMTESYSSLCLRRLLSIAGKTMGLALTTWVQILPLPFIL